MKKVTIMMSLLLTLGMFSACSSNDDEMDIIKSDLFVNEDDDLVPMPEDGKELEPVNLIEIQNRENLEQLNGGPVAGNIIKNLYFYNEELPIGRRSESFFVESDKDECYVINSIQELQFVYHGEKELPELDFDQYTLVIGQKVMPKVFYPVLSQKLEFRNGQCELSLHVPAINDKNTTSLPFYFWAIYPKFNTRVISFSFVKDEDAVKFVNGATGLLHYGYGNNWTIGYYHPNSIDWVDVYYPFNLPDELTADDEKQMNVSFSGYVVEMTDNSLSALGMAPLGGHFYYFVYPTEIHKTE